MLNRAFRTTNDDLLLLFRFIIRDIQDQLSSKRMSLPVRVFRSQLMSSGELNLLRSFMGEFIAINSFFSTSVEHAYALFLLNSSLGGDM